MKITRIAEGSWENCYYIQAGLIVVTYYIAVDTLNIGNNAIAAVVNSELFSDREFSERLTLERNGCDVLGLEMEEL